MTPAAISSPTLTPADLGFYQKHGWLITGAALDDGILAAAERGLHRHWAGHRDRFVPGAGKRFADWMPGDGEGDRTNEFLALQNNLVSELAWSPIVGAISAATASSREIRFFGDRMVYKPAGQIALGENWRVDAHNWGTCTSHDMLSASIPLHDCDHQAGPIVVLDGSHKWSHKVGGLLNKDLAQIVRDLGYDFRPVVLEMKRGQFSLHNCRTIYGRHPNRSNRPSIALTVHMQDGHNDYRPTGRPIYNEILCRKTAAGLPDYKDEEIFPVMWSTAESKGEMWAL